MKLSKIVASVALLTALSAGAATSEHNDFLKEKSFGKFSFIGCVIKVDNPGNYVYVNLTSTILKTFSNQVAVESASGTFNQRLDDKDGFVKEFIYRQNYCSFIR